MSGILCRRTRIHKGESDADGPRSVGSLRSGVPARLDGVEMGKLCDDGQDHIEIRVPCKAEYVRTVRVAAAEFARSFDLGAQDVEAIEVAVSEAVSNVIRHAYKGCAKTLPIRMRCERRGDSLRFEIEDRGRGFAAPADNVIPDPDLSREGGLGIILIKRLMDSVSYTSRPNAGTRITMTKRATKHRNAGGVTTPLIAAPG